MVGLLLMAICVVGHKCCVAEKNRERGCAIKIKYLGFQSIHTAHYSYHSLLLLHLGHLEFGVRE
jgi:hypothetical protein